MRILLLSAYHTDSHQSWCDGLMAQFPEHQWTLLSLPGRYFSWRIRGNALSWSCGEFAQIDGQYDLLIATSMVDLAALRGLKPHLGQTRCILYMHENQFAYPVNASQFNSVEPAMVNLYSALAADRVLFNSHYNLSSFLQGVETLLRKLPDHAPLSLLATLRQKSRVLPVPLNLAACLQPRPINADMPLKVLWNHRWEYDKGPDTLAALLEKVEEQALPIEFYLLGRQFRQIPTHLQQVLARQPRCVKHRGFLPKEAYLALLAECHVALSTALHEFQGLALLEAAAMGATPLAPARLAYPEWLPAAYLYPDAQGDAQAESEAILQRLLAWRNTPATPPHGAAQYLWSNLHNTYIDELTGH
jgi:glycosyltransferase involved in cell wall biosynthesis